MIQQGQASLEFLILTMAVLSFFLLFFPILTQFYHKSLDWFEFKKADFFASQIQNSIEELSFLSNGSSLKLNIHSSQEWRVLFYEDKIQINWNQQMLEKQLSVSVKPVQFVCLTQCPIQLLKENNEIQVNLLE
ncbi:MAG: hypothetical protein Q7S92_00760 [Candidatus Diapherotrites archaeon]|nr:hypothetical protein [Candidatus Diapherotrites archaeon]